MFKRVHVPLILFAFFLIWTSHAAGAGSSRWTDDAGQPLPPDATYRKVVSLVPSATEIIVALGAGDALAGITFHDTGYYFGDRRKNSGLAGPGHPKHPTSP